MQHTLELLAPARNLSIGIAAIDCGADAVYIAGPAFGARQAAGNSVEDIRALCTYAHRYGARIFVTVNTILYDSELEEARQLVHELAAAGVDALIVQDFALLELCKDLSLPLHASTQCAIRTPERAALFEGLGFSRVVPERQLSLAEIRAIRGAVGCEIECFVHGALCVCYSGNCYLSEYIDGRSANRGACIQACRSRYDLVDAAGKVLVRDKALLSLRDFNLLHRLEDLAEAGVCSFKIEGRLKSLSYVRNAVRAYSIALDGLVARHPDRYRRASFGRVTEGFRPDLNKTFQRGYTELYLDGRRERNWSSADAPKSIGEPVGNVRIVRGAQVELDLLPGIRLRNGDGFAFLAGGEVIGFRGDVCEGRLIRCNRPVDGLRAGMRLFRNISAEFEKEMDSQPCRRMLSVQLDVVISSDLPSVISSDLPSVISSEVEKSVMRVTAHSEDGRIAEADFPTAGFPIADNQQRMQEILLGQLSKTSGHYSFTVKDPSFHGLDPSFHGLDPSFHGLDPSFHGLSVESKRLPLLKAAFLNDIRRHMAELLDAQPCGRLPLYQISPLPSVGRNDRTATPSDLPPVISSEVEKSVTYKENIANALSRAAYKRLGAASVEPAYELSHKAGAELMRSRYCIRYELGLCPRHQGARDTGPLFLLNNGRRFALHFHCATCEMTVDEA